MRKTSRTFAAKKKDRLRSKSKTSVESLSMSNTYKVKEMTASDSGSDFDRSDQSDFTTSAIRVDIADLSDVTNSINITTSALRKCKVYVLVPYSRLLQLIGWKAFGKDSVHSNHWAWRLLNACYAGFILLLVIYTYIYDVMACQWKLDLKEDTKAKITTTLEPSTHHRGNHSNHSIKATLINASAFELKQHIKMEDVQHCQHIATTYIIPDLLHLAAYLLGILYFRIRENEQLYALMEKVFLQTSVAQSKSLSQTKLISHLRFFFVLGALWVFLAVGLQCLFVYTFGLDRDNVLHLLTPDSLADSYSTYISWLWFLFALDLTGVAIANCINLAVVLNYATQCELLMYYISSIGSRLKERSSDLKACMKDVLSVRESISLLNSSLSRMTSLAVVRFAELVIIGISILIVNEDNRWCVWLYRSLFPALWLTILTFPLVQAAKLNSVCNKFKALALNVRVFGYGTTSLDELDSFLLFISHASLRVKLLHIPVKPSYLLGTLLIVCFTLLLLFQTGVFGSAVLLF